MSKRRCVIGTRPSMMKAMLIAGVMSVGASYALMSQAADHRDSLATDAIQEGDFSDVFAFVDPIDPSKTNLIMAVNVFANPNLNHSYRFAEELLYQMKIDNSQVNGAREDLVLQINFHGGKAAQTYDVVLGTPTATGPLNNKRISGTTLCSDKPVYLGSAAANPTFEQARGTPALGSLCFAGIRDDSFVTDVAQAIFRIGLNPDPLANAPNHTQDVYRGFVSLPFGPLRGRPLRVNGTSGVDGFGGFNLTVIAVQVPNSLLRGSGIDCQGLPGCTSATVGIWGTVSRPTAETFDGTTLHQVGDTFNQFERMGQQLVNTVFAFQQPPLNSGPNFEGTAALKDRFNASGPEDDIVNFGRLIPDALTTQGTPGALNNTIAGRALLLTLAGFTLPVTGTPLLVNQLVNDGPSSLRNNTDRRRLQKLLLPDYMRLNLDIAPNAVRPGASGAGNSDVVMSIGRFGLQNGRRPGDDVTDIVLRIGREIIDVKFPDQLRLPIIGVGLGSLIGLVPGAGPLVDRRALRCEQLQVDIFNPQILVPCEDARIFNVLQGTDWIEFTQFQVNNLANQGNVIPLSASFPYHGLHPVPGEPGTVGFPAQQ